MRLARCATTLVLLLGAGCEEAASSLEVEALFGLWLVGDEARELKIDLRFEEFVRDDTGWQVVRRGTFGLLGPAEIAGTSVVDRLLIQPEAQEAIYPDVFGRDPGVGIEQVEGIVSLDGDVLTTVTPYSEGPITSTRVESLP